MTVVVSARHLWPNVVGRTITCWLLVTNVDALLVTRLEKADVLNNTSGAQNEFGEP